LCARRIQRHRQFDRASQSGTEFFGAELREEDGALEGVVAGGDGAIAIRLSPLRKQGPITANVRGYETLKLQRASTIDDCGYGSRLSARWSLAWPGRQRGLSHHA